MIAVRAELIAAVRPDPSASLRTKGLVEGCVVLSVGIMLRQAQHERYREDNTITGIQTQGE
jgi:hypothetical protein